MDFALDEQPSRRSRTSPRQVLGDASTHEQPPRARARRRPPIRRDALWPTWPRRASSAPSCPRPTAERGLELVALRRGARGGRPHRCRGAVLGDAGPGRPADGRVRPRGDSPPRCCRRWPRGRWSSPRPGTRTAGTAGAHHDDRQPAPATTGRSPAPRSACRPARSPTPWWSRRPSRAARSGLFLVRTADLGRGDRGPRSRPSATPRPRSCSPRRRRPLIAEGTDAVEWAYERAVASQCSLAGGRGRGGPGADRRVHQGAQAVRRAHRLVPGGRTPGRGRLHRHRGRSASPPSRRCGASSTATRRPRRSTWPSTGRPRAGQRIVQAGQHLHGGIGVDRDYPLHRYFFQAKQIELPARRGNPAPRGPRPTTGRGARLRHRVNRRCSARRQLCQPGASAGASSAGRRKR